MLLREALTHEAEELRLVFEELLGVELLQLILHWLVHHLRHTQCTDQLVHSALSA